MSRFQTWMKLWIPTILISLGLCTPAAAEYYFAGGPCCSTCVVKCYRPRVHHRVCHKKKIHRKVHRVYVRRVIVPVYVPNVRCGDDVCWRRTYCDSCGYRPNWAVYAPTEYNYDEVYSSDLSTGDDPVWNSPYNNAW